MLFARRYNLNKVRLMRFLENLKASSKEIVTLYFPPNSLKIKIESKVEKIFDTKIVPEELYSSISGSPTGGIIFGEPCHLYLVIPPFPIEREGVSNTCEIEPLYSLMHNEFLLGLIIVRLGEYGIGVFQGEKLLSSKVGTGLVHSRHRQGGSSSRGFEGHREKQIETFFTRVCQHTREQLESRIKQLDFVLYGGTRETILDFRKQCHFLHEFDKRTLGRLLDVRKAKQSGLVEGIQEAWTSRVIHWDFKQV